VGGTLIVIVAGAFIVYSGGTAAAPTVALAYTAILTIVSGAAANSSQVEDDFA